MVSGTVIMGGGANSNARKQAQTRDNKERAGSISKKKATSNTSSAEVSECQGTTKGQIAGAKKEKVKSQR